MIYSSHHCTNHPFHLQLEKQTSHTVHRNIRFYYQCIDMQISLAGKNTYNTFLVFTQFRKKITLNAFRLNGFSGRIPPHSFYKIFSRLNESGFIITYQQIAPS